MFALLSSSRRNSKKINSSNKRFIPMMLMSIPRLYFLTLFLVLLVLTTFSSQSSAFASSFSTTTATSSLTKNSKRPGNRRSKPTAFIKNSRPLVSLTTTASNDDDDNDNEETSSSSSSSDDTEAELHIPTTTTSADAIRGGAAAGRIRDPPPPQPTLAQYRNFAVPCLALWVAGPLLSLVDTSFVGLSSASEASAQQLASLGPATTFFDGATYLFAFLNVATTNLYSSARAQYGAQSDAAESVVRTSAQVALKCGLGLMLFVLLVGRPLLQLYIGHKACRTTPGLLDAACDYVSIRALSIPTSLLLGVLQAALLGAKDSVTPLVAILYSTVINVIGDYILVSRMRFGLQGAAIATTLAQWAATAALIPAAQQKLVQNHSLGLVKKQSADKQQQTKNANSNTVTAKSFLGFAAPVLTLILGKLAAFGFMTHSAAAVPGQPTPLAAHQIILSLLFFCSPFLEVISQTAQTFLPPFLAPVKDHVNAQKKKNANYNVQDDAVVEPWLTASKKVATSLLGMGFASASVVASIAALIPAKFGNLITTDPVIQEAIQPLAKYLWMGAFFWAPVAVSEGVLLARLELKFLAGIYLLSTALLPPALLQIKFRQGTVGQVWGCFVVFQMFRALMFTGRIWGEFALQRLFGKNKQQQPTSNSRRRRRRRFRKAKAA